MSTLNSGKKEDNKVAAKFIEKEAGQLDVIIANVGKKNIRLFRFVLGYVLIIIFIGSSIAKYYGPLATTPISEFEDHWKVNAMGSSCYSKQPTNSSPHPQKPPSSLSSPPEQHPSARISQCRLRRTDANFLVKVLDAKKGLIAFSILPGWVATEMVSSPHSLIYPP